jgi:hypothetical protein
MKAKAVAAAGGGIAGGGIGGGGIGGVVGRRGESGVESGVKAMASRPAWQCSCLVRRRLKLEAMKYRIWRGINEGSSREEASV